MERDKTTDPIKRDDLRQRSGVKNDGQDIPPVNNTPTPPPPDPTTEHDPKQTNVARDVTSDR